MIPQFEFAVLHTPFHWSSLFQTPLHGVRVCVCVYVCARRASHPQNGSVLFHTLPRGLKWGR
eukprot:7969616-Alexandrium_andersonii.AAC.1